MNISRTHVTGPVAFAVFTLAIALGACSKAPAPTPEPEAAPTAGAAGAPPPRLVFLGLDAGTWDLLGPWMDRGLLPNLARLRAEGVHGKLRSTQPSSSPVIWTSIATGKTPEKHGIDWFVRFPDGPGKPVPVDRRLRKVKTLWNILGSRGLDVAVLGWFVTWPAEEVNGRLLSDIAHYGDTEGEAFPPEFLSSLPPVPQTEAIAALPSFMDFAYDPSRAVKKEGEPPTLDYLVYDRFLRAYSRDLFYLEAAEKTLADGPLPEALFLYLRGTDDVQHGFWKFMQPEGFADVTPEQQAALGHVIERYWQFIDDGVGKVLSHYRKEPPLVFAASDHGAGPALGDVHVDVPAYMHLSGAHHIDGFFIAAGPGIRRGEPFEGATIYDLAPTILHALGMPSARDMDGRVLTGIFDEKAAARPLETVDTFEQGDSAGEGGAELPAEVDKKVLEHLRSLGYIQ